MIPDLRNLTGASGGWVLLALKALAAMGFMTVANVIILYACWKNGGFGYWRDPVFLISLATYVINRLLIKPHLHHYSPLFHGHLNDTLTVPVALPIYLFVYRQIGFRPDNEPPRWWEVALHVAVWMVFFKWFGPVILRHGVADPIDDWSIAGGGLAAWALWRLGRLTRTNPSKRIR